MERIERNYTFFLGDGEHYLYLRQDRNGAPDTRVIIARKCEPWYGLQIGSKFDWSDEREVLNFKYEGQQITGLLEQAEAKLLLLQAGQAMSLTERIEKFAKDWESWRHEKIQKRFPTHEYEVVEVRYTKLWAKVIIRGNDAIAFVALSDSNNKKLGDWKQGDIFMPDTWNSPAKHKRGSVFSENPLSCMNEWGVNYLR